MTTEINSPTAAGSRPVRPLRPLPSCCGSVRYDGVSQLPQQANEAGVPQGGGMTGPGTAVSAAGNGVTSHQTPRRSSVNCSLTR